MVFHESRIHDITTHLHYPFSLLFLGDWLMNNNDETNKIIKYTTSNSIIGFYIHIRKLLVNSLLNKWVNRKIIYTNMRFHFICFKSFFANAT